MGYTPHPLDSFGLGLNLRDRTDSVRPGECIDGIDFLPVPDLGAVRQRDGYTNFTSSTLTNRAASLEPFYTTSGTRQLVAGCGTRLEALNTSGGVVASATGLTDGTWDFARFGGPGQERVYAGQGSQNLNYWDGSTWTTAVANTPDAGSLCVMPVSNRLVAGRFNTTTGGPDGSASSSSPSHVYFSDAGDPATWTTTNFIQVTPGDGEKVQAVVAWREFVFIFKESKFAVVYGESQDAGGDPIFNYRMVDARVGCVGPRAAVAGRDGVYFLDRSGIYRTTGGEPEQVSDIVDPIFTGATSEFYNDGAFGRKRGTCRRS